ncbi:BRCA1-associated RING domain protein 1 isoform X2 [Anabrus simplex]|uniref:BRCA1-associated RING domain protein 1 isoform X2 n=1 Tax=Anabrus simplex TaxID=316456 RepID=UPI0035A2C27C
MTLPELFVWKHSKESLTKLEELLKCQLCKMIFKNPLRFSVCGHLVCKECTEDASNICPVCDVPSCKSDITSDHIFQSIITGYELISKLLSPGRSSKEVTDHKETTNDVSCGLGKGHEVNSNKQQPKCALPISRNSKRDDSESRRTRSSDRKLSKTLAKTKVIDVCGDDDSKQNKKKSNRRSGNAKDSPQEQTESKPDHHISDPPMLNSPGHQKSNPTRHSLNKEIMKRNKKGETPLHVACIKGDIKRIEELLEAGASPCTKDNAGWTPLHEAVSKGYKDIVQLLLENGAFVNAPGLYNNTPLHDAVIHQRLDILPLLLAYGADPDVCNIEGNSARNLAETDAVLEILEKRPAERKSTMLLKAISFEEPVILGCNLDPENQKMLTKFVQIFKLKLINIFNSDVNHVVVEVNDNQCSPSVPILHAILTGKWLINTSWIYQCLHQNALVDPGDFEVKGTVNYPNSEGPRKGRINAEQLLPSIFNGCFFYLASGKYSFGESVFTKNDLTALIRSGGGVLLTREPNPEAIPPMECTVPYHARGSGPFASCSHYIIYQPGRGEPQLKYSMAHVKSLPVSWLLQCMETFSLVPP